MTSRKVPLSPIHLGEEEIKAAEEVLRSGQLREGNKTREFEEAFARQVGARHAIAASSGTAALHLAYLATIQPGDEVLVPTFTFIATASMVVMAGGKPVFCDIDPQTWTLDPEEIEKRMTPKTKAVAGVHLFGNACDIDQIQIIARKHGLKLIWDAAQSLGTSYQEKEIGGFDDIVCFSFYPTKNITTGEGGMAVTSNNKLADKIRLLKQHGHTEKYLHELIGLNYRMTEMEAAIGQVQLKRLPEFLEKRKRLAAIYIQSLSGNPCFDLQRETPNSRHSYNYFSILFKENALEISRDEFAKALSQEGIQNAIHYPRPLHKQPCFGTVANGSLPVAESVSERILSLPMSPFLSEEDILYTCDRVNSLARKFSRKQIFSR